MGGVVAVTMARHVESVAGSGAAFVVVTCQGVVEPRSIHRREWSRFVAITAACHVEPVAGSGGAAQNPSQEVEQSRGRYCGLPGNPGLSTEARLKHLTERGGHPPLGALSVSTIGEGHLLQEPSQRLSVDEVQFP